MSGLGQACVDLIGRCGADELQVRYDDQQQPPVWIAVARWTVLVDDGEQRAAKVGAGLNETAALLQLAEAAVDGGTCARCGRTSGVDADWANPRPDVGILGGPTMCWFVYDPELDTFRRGCA